MGFPCNQFGGQEPKDEPAIKQFVTSKFNVQFPMFSKIDVNGDNTHPVYQFLKGEQGAFPGDITWNFASKFLVDRNGIPVKRYERQDWSEIEEDIESYLAQDPAESAKL